MSWLDLAILSILIINFIYSLCKGAVREVFSLVALFIGYIAASKTHAYGAAYLLLVLKNPTLARVISFVAVFILVSLLVGFIGKLVHDLTQRAKLTFPNRLLGGAMGLLKGGVMVVVFLIIATHLFPETRPLAQGSKIAPTFLRATELLMKMVPADLSAPVSRNIDKLKRVRKNWFRPTEKVKAREGAPPQGISEEDSERLKRLLEDRG